MISLLVMKTCQGIDSQAISQKHEMLSKSTYIMSGLLPIIISRDTARATPSVCPRYRQMRLYAMTLWGFLLWAIQRTSYYPNFSYAPPRNIYGRKTAPVQVPKALLEKANQNWNRLAPGCTLSPTFSGNSVFIRAWLGADFICLLGTFNWAKQCFFSPTGTGIYAIIYQLDFELS